MTRKTCCCCIGLHTGVLVLGILFLLASGIIFVSSTTTLITNGTSPREDFQNAAYTLKDSVGDNVVVNLITSLVWAACAILLIYGNRTLRHSLYIPFIVIMIIWLVWDIVKIVLVAIATIVVASGNVKEIEDKNLRTHYIIGGLIGILVWSIGFVVGAYFTYVVIKGRRYLIDEEVECHVTYSQRISDLETPNSHVTVMNKV